MFPPVFGWQKPQGQHTAGASGAQGLLGHGKTKEAAVEKASNMKPATLEPAFKQQCNRHSATNHSLTGQPSPAMRPLSPAFRSRAAAAPSKHTAMATMYVASAHLLRLLQCDVEVVLFVQAAAAWPPLQHERDCAERVDDCVDTLSCAVWRRHVP